MTEDGRFSYESLQDAKSIARYLQALIEGFEKGTITLQSDQGQLVLYPNEMLTLAIRAKKKNEKTKLTLKISWRDVGDPDDSFSIKA